MRTRLAAFPVVAILLVYLVPAAHAEPQALGLVATGKPVPLQCAYGVCQAFLSAFCLEERRPPPLKRSRYRPLEGTHVLLVVQRADGTTMRLEGGDWLNFGSNLAFTSVLATIEERRLAALGAVAVSVEVGPLATLVPEPEPGDANPHDAAELALAGGALRQAAQHHFEAADWRGQTARKTAELVNALPPFRAVPTARLDAAFAERIAGDDSLQPAARRELSAIGARCKAMADESWRMTLRQCLEFEHSVLQTELNRVFWKSLGGV